MGGKPKFSPGPDPVTPLNIHELLEAAEELIFLSG